MFIYSAGLGGMLIEAMDIQKMSSEELVQLAQNLAQNQGIELRKYQV